jgi:membrane-bound lytic murein transglycosylase MltF
MNIKKLFTLLTFLLLIILLVIYVPMLITNWKTMKTKRDLPEIEKNHTLKVVTEYNSVDFHASGDSIAGFQYDVCSYISQRSGLTIQFYLENDLETAIWKLEHNECDVIAQNIPISNESKKRLAFTVPITHGKQVLVQRKQNNNDSVAFITNQLGLANRMVYVTKNSPAILRLKHLADEIAEPIHIKEISGYTSEQLIYMVAKKDIDYAVVAKEISLKNARLFPDLDFDTDISFTQLQAWALRKTSPVLLDSLNAWITAYKQQ